MSSDNYPYIYTIFQPFQENFKGFNKKTKKIVAAAKKKEKAAARAAAERAAAAAATARAAAARASAAKQAELEKKWNADEEARKDKKIAEYDDLIDEKRIEFEADKSFYKDALDEISAETDDKKEEWNTFKSAYCPSQGTFDLNDLKNNFGENYPDLNRYEIIKSETKSTYDLLKRSEICTTIDNSELIKKYNDKVNKQEEILKNEHSELLRFFEKNIYNLNKREIEEKENREKSGANIHSTSDNINKRKSFYQGILSHERLGYIRLVEIIYIILWALMAFSLILKPEISMKKKFIYIIIFLILPYLSFNYFIYYLNSIRNYFNKNFNVYDNVYNHVK